MPVRRNNAKSAAKPLAKKVAAKKRPVKKSVPKEETPGQRLANAIVGGALDGDLRLIDDALTERTNAMTEEKTEKTTPAKTTKKVSAPPKRTTSESLVLHKGSSYSVSASLKTLAGAKVKFIRYKAGSEKKKSVIEMQTDKPGSPKGKQVVIPTAALMEFKATHKK